MRNKKDIRYTVRFNDLDAAKLNELAKKLNISVAQIIRFATTELLKKYDNCKP